MRSGSLTCNQTRNRGLHTACDKWVTVSRSLYVQYTYRVCECVYVYASAPSSVVFTDWPSRSPHLFISPGVLSAS